MIAAGDLMRTSYNSGKHVTHYLILKVFDTTPTRHYEAYILEDDRYTTVYDLSAVGRSWERI